MTIWRVPYPKFGQGPGLVRVGRIAADLDVDLPAFGAGGAVIVGSNGKGSTAAMTASLLDQVSADTGLFTSPHLFDLNERFRVGGEDISDEELVVHWRRVAIAIDRAGFSDQIGGFEFLFLIAADWFAARKCAHTVWEAGIGGRLDPVRLINAQQLALTSLDLEHTELLGDTLEAIAIEKLAAAPDGARVFVQGAIGADGNLRAVIEAHAHEADLALSFVPPHGAMTSTLIGAHQQSNAALAVAVSRAIASLDESAINSGLAAARWPGRLERINDEPLVVIDVGHTPDGVRAARAGFETMRAGREAVLVCGVSEDKDAAAIVHALAPGFSTIIAASARHKGAPAAHIAAHAQTANPNAEIVLAESVADARRLALAKARGGAIYVAGGLFLAAEFKAVLLGRDPASLVFF